MYKILVCGTDLLLFLGCWPCRLFHFLHFLNRLTRSALLTISIISQQRAVAVAAAFRQVWVLWREHLHLLARIEFENLLFGRVSNAIGGGASLVGIALRVLAFENLHGGAAAVPTVGRQIVVPELVGGRQGYAVECGVLFAHAVLLALQRADTRKRGVY